MKKTIVGCDICKTEIDVSSPDYIQVALFSGPPPLPSTPQQRVPKHQFDLCEGCTPKLFALLYPKGVPADVHQE